MQHAAYEENDPVNREPVTARYRGGRFYKELREWNEERYNALFEQWRVWLTKSQALIFEATRAANWLADCARRFVNPGFFAVEGKFHLIPSPVRGDIPGDLWIPEHTAAERRELPQELPERFENYRRLFPFRLTPDD